MLIYAAGAPHTLHEPCTRVLQLVASGRLDAVTSAEVVQEILHRFTRSPRGEDGAELAAATLDLFSPVLPVSHEVMLQMPDLVRRYPGHTARDLVHVATCMQYGITALISPDADFDRVDEIRRIVPSDDEALKAHLR